MKFKIIIRILSIIVILVKISCISPTFESARVTKGMEGWIGGSVGYGCFDYILTSIWGETDSFVSTMGIVGTGGIGYGFVDTIGMTLESSFYLMRIRHEDKAEITKFFLSGYLAPKFEMPRNKEDLLLSLSFGPAFPEVIKTRVMFGAKIGKKHMITLGTNLVFFLHIIDVFANFGPIENSGITIYLGYRVYNRANLAFGLGYRFR